MTALSTSINDCKLLHLPRVFGERKGNLTYLSGQEHVPFEINRVYYLYDVPGGAERAGHAHKELNQVLLSVSGSFDVLLDDGALKKTINLNRPYYGLFIPPFIWRKLINFSSGSVCLNFVSLVFSDHDYIRDYDQFIKLKSSHLK
ncbi:FdtA/QdtA family cupin domain-containing protein [Acidobacteriota bacterium]